MSQANRHQCDHQQVTSWAAIIAVPTAVTGFYGRTCRTPGSASRAGVAVAVVLMLIASATLYFVFKAKDWL